jgi:cell division inhibitor SepF
MNWNLKRNKNVGNDAASADEAFSFDDEVMDETDEDEVVGDAPVAAPSIPTPVAPKEPIGFGASISLKIVNPKEYDKDRAAEIADFLIAGNTILLNIEALDPSNIKRYLDYLSGATHAIGGMMTRVGKTTIVVSPKNVDVSSIEAMVGTTD